MTSKVKMKKSTCDRKVSKIPVPVWKQPLVCDQKKSSEQVGKESHLAPWLTSQSFTLTGEPSEGSVKNVFHYEKPVSRVDKLMNNELFKKHLIKHADLLKRHTLSSQRFQLRKAMSNIDLSQSYDTVRDDPDSSIYNTNVSNTEIKSLSNDTKIKSNCLRRQSFSCDQNPSDLNTNTTNCTSSHSLSTKQRLYIPSFSEFKRTRQALSVSCDRFDILKDDFCFHSLDTIKEDEHVNQSRTSLSISNVPSLSACEQSKPHSCSVVSARSHPNKTKSERSPSDIMETDDTQCYDSQETVDEVFMEDNNFSENDTKLQNFPDTRISPVFRSTSDVCTTYNQSIEAQRKRRLRKQRQCKSEPFIRVQSSDRDRLSAHSYDRNTDLVGSACSLTTTSGNISTATSFMSFGEESEQGDQCSNCELNVGACEKRCSNLSLTSNDSGVVHQCPDQLDVENTADCNSDVQVESCLTLHSINGSVSEDQPSAFCNCLESRLERSSTGSFEDSDVQPRSLCTTCQKLKMTQREIIHEICEVEMNYGRDLNILKEEIYTPLKLAGLLTCEQLEQIFGNLDDLIRNNSLFCKKLRSVCSHSENLCNVNMGLLFLDSTNMFSAFEKYCLNQNQAITVLDQIIKEKELLKIFLQVSQTENTLLRRMHLKSFLMLPVQQVVRYPLILKRLYKVTPQYHQDRENIKIAQIQMEEFLSRINSRVNVSSQPKRKSHFEKTRHRVYSTERHEMQAIAMDVVGWNKKEGYDLICSKIWLGQPTDHMWAAKKCKNVKFTQLHAVLLALKKTNGMLERRGSTQERKNSVLERRGSSSSLFPNQSSSVEKAAVVLLREKNGKFQVLREPLALEKCVVTVDPEYDEAFEIQEWGKEAYVIKCDDVKDTKLWIHHLKQQTKDLNQWRKRRNAMPNIMLKKVT